MTLVVVELLTNKKEEKMEKELKEKQTNEKGRGNELGLAIFLITLGVFFVFASFTKWSFLGLLFLPFLGISFFVWSMLSREEGFLVPAQILFSLGIAVILMSKVFNKSSSFQSVAVNLISMGIGWIIMPVVSRLALKKNMDWGYIPGGVLITIGAIFLLPAAVSTKAFEVLGYLGKSIRYIWPFALIIPGIFIIIKVIKSKK